MIKREEGFSLVELLVTMVVFVLILTATSNTFIDLLKDFKKQSAQSETNIEGAVGLETLRRDITSAGYGLPWNVSGVTDADSDGRLWEDLASYSEAASAPESTFNDATRDSDADTNPGDAPRAVVGGNNMNYGAGNIFNGSDYLVIKAVNVATNVTSQKWTHLKASDVKTDWTPVCENVDRDAGCNTVSTVRVTVINPGGTDTNQRALVVAGGAFSAQYDSTDPFAPATGSTDVYVLYGVSPNNTNLWMPFNRADYFIERPAGYLSTCAPNTGALYKALISQTNGTIPSTNKHPILDCVADMQVVFELDMNDDGVAGTESTPENVDGPPATAPTVSGTESATPANVASTLADASLLRQRLKEVRVYILAQEGQRDTSYTSPATITVGPNATSGRDFSIAGANLNYRWKIYTLVVKTENLR